MCVLHTSALKCTYYHCATVRIPGFVRLLPNIPKFPLCNFRQRTVRIDMFIPQFHFLFSTVRDDVKLQQNAFIFSFTFFLLIFFYTTGSPNRLWSTYSLVSPATFFTYYFKTCVDHATFDFSKRASLSGGTNQDACHTTQSRMATCTNTLSMSHYDPFPMLSSTTEIIALL